MQYYPENVENVKATGTIAARKALDIEMLKVFHIKNFKKPNDNSSKAAAAAAEKNYFNYIFAIIKQSKMISICTVCHKS